MSDDLDPATTPRIRAEEPYRAQFRAKPLAARRRARWSQAILLMSALVVLGVCLIQLDGRSELPRGPATVRSLPPAQNLAMIDGLSPDDPVMAAQFGRLDAQCPENGDDLGDAVVRLQDVVKRDSGRDVPLLSLVRQLAAAHGAANQRRKSCMQTAAALSVALVKGR